MIVTRLDTTALSNLAADLADAGLPTSDLAEPGHGFFRFEDDAGIAGYGDMEGNGPDGLLRSLVVKRDRRSGGLGTAMLGAIERVVPEEGVASLYLLTTTAEPFFRRHGYVTANRADAPDAITGSAEFRSLCPASATFLSKRIA